MSDLVLILEHAPTPQRESRRIYFGGGLSIGRGDDADWQIDDPDMFVSRKHCVISDEGGVPTVTDASRGGLFVDGASQPLGPGNSVALEHDMRLRLGDFVIRVEMEDATPKTAAPQSRGGAFSFEFEPAKEPEERRERPRDLPAPFGLRTDNRPTDREEKPVRPPRPLDDNDPFALDLAPRRADPPPRDETPSQSSDYFSGVGQSGPEPGPTPPPAEQASGPVEPAAQSAPAATADDRALREAFFRGLGLDAARHPTDDPLAEMEEIGRRFRALTDGLVHLLRTRAQEKQKVRVAQTMIGSANVNPLKFAVGTDDAVQALLSSRGDGYLAPDAAIDEAYRDLADHQVRTWSALQTALRRMIDRFDPQELERELEEAGLLETLLAGGRSAKLWQLYEERYRDIARSAEERFLGEVGSDFRDAYEDKRRN